MGELTDWELGSRDKQWRKQAPEGKTSTVGMGGSQDSSIKEEMRGHQGVRNYLGSTPVEAVKQRIWRNISGPFVCILPGSRMISECEQA